MIELLSIFQYLVLSVTDVFDKFLISKRKIEPVSYTFFTVVTGAVLVVIWPWVYAAIPAKNVWLDVLAGAWFSVAYLIFYRALAEGEVSRVVPFVFGLVPVFDLLIGWLVKRNVLTVAEIAAVCLLIPGSILISYSKNSWRAGHVLLKVAAAAAISGYNLLWGYASHTGPFFNNFLWNRSGSALILVLPLIVPWYRRKIFSANKVEKKSQTSFLFLFKQVLGGGNFIFLSYLYSAGTVAVIDSLQGFRYVFLTIGAFILSKRKKQILSGEFDRHHSKTKIAGLILIFAGTLILFL